MQQGSKNATVRGGRAVMYEQTDKRLKSWRSLVASRVEEEMAFAGLEPFHGPMMVEVTFGLPRPKAHYVANDRSRDLKESAPYWKDGKPDIDKLTRALLDALTAVAFADDAQVCKLVVEKLWADAGYTTVKVDELMA